MNYTARLDSWLRERGGAARIGEVAILPVEGRYEVRHFRDVPASSPPGEAPLPGRQGSAILVQILGHLELAEMVKKTRGGSFRPLRGAPSLREGWRLGPLDAAGLVQALNLIYPGALASWAEREDGTLEATEFGATARRQTGMYRIAQVITAAQLAATVVQVCEEGCLRRRLWQPASRDEAATPGTLPLLCPEACNYFVAQARERIVADKKDAGE